MTSPPVNPRAVLAFGIVMQALIDRLWDPLDPREPGASELKHQLRQLNALLADGDSPEARWQLTRFESFITDWDVVAHGMPDYMKELRRRFVADEQRGGYAGTRSELAIAAFLLRKGIPLTRCSGEGTDFAVSRPEGKVFLESTSAHLISPREDNFYKIESAIRHKASRLYCGPDALLHVDYTAILRHGGDTLGLDFPARIRAVVASTKWGVVVLSAFMVSSEGNEYYRAIVRCDGPAQTTALKSFLAEFLPQGEHRLAPVSVPPTS